MVWIRNPGLERTVNALSSLVIDYGEGEDARRQYDESLHGLWKIEGDGKRTNLIQLHNERGEIRAFSSEYYVSHTAGPMETFEEMQWWLPPGGESPPNREE